MKKRNKMEAVCESVSRSACKQTVRVHTAGALDKCHPTEIRDRREKRRRKTIRKFKFALCTTFTWSLRSRARVSEGFVSTP